MQATRAELKKYKKKYNMYKGISEDLDQTNLELDESLHERNEAVKELETMVKERDDIIARLENESSDLNEFIGLSDDVSKVLREELSKKEAEIEAKTAALKERDATISRQKATITSLDLGRSGVSRSWQIEKDIGAPTLQQRYDIAVSRADREEQLNIALQAEMKLLRDRDEEREAHIKKVEKKIKSLESQVPAAAAADAAAPAPQQYVDVPWSRIL